MNLGNNPPVLDIVLMDETGDSKSETKSTKVKTKLNDESKAANILWRDGLADAKVALRLLKNENIRNKLPVTWLYHLSKQISDEEFIAIFNSSRKIWLDEVTQRVGKSPVIQEETYSDKAVPEFVEALNAIFQFKGNKEELFWICRCYPEFIPYVHIYHQDVFNITDFQKLALYNAQARETILHLNGLHPEITADLVRKLPNHTTLSRQKEKGLLKVEDYNWHQAFLYVQSICNSRSVQESEQAIINNLVLIATKFQVLAIYIYDNENHFYKYISEFSPEQHADILCKNFVLAARFSDTGNLNEKFFGFDNFVRILECHIFITENELCCFTEKEKGLLKKICIKSASIVKWVFCHKEFKKALALFTEDDFIDIFQKHPDVAEEFFSNEKRSLKYVQKFKRETLERFCKNIPKTQRFLQKFIDGKDYAPPPNNKLYYDEMDNTEEKNLNFEPIAPGDTVYFFDQAVLDRFKKNVNSIGNCTGLALAFLGWCSMHPKKDYQFYAKELHKVNFYGKKLLENSNFVHQIYFFQLNQEAYKQKHKKFFFDELNPEYVKDLIKQILYELDKNPYLLLQTHEHSIAIAKNIITGKITVFDSNFYLQTFSMPQDRDDLFENLADLFDHIISDDDFTLWVYFITPGMIKTPLPLTPEGNKSNEQKSEATNEMLPSPLFTLFEPILQSMAIRDYDKAWKLLWEQNPQEKLEVDFCEFLEKMIDAIRLDRGIVNRNLRQQPNNIPLPVLSRKRKADKIESKSEAENQTQTTETRPHKIPNLNKFG